MPIDIEPKHILALIFLVVSGSIGLLLTLLSQRGRDCVLFFFVFAAPMMEAVNATFLGVNWYRGTSRGLEVSALDLLPLCLLIASVLVPRYPRGRFYWPASFTMLVIYFLYCLVSVCHSPVPNFGVWEFVLFVCG